MHKYFSIPSNGEGVPTLLFFFVSCLNRFKKKKIGKKTPMKLTYDEDIFFRIRESFFSHSLHWHVYGIKSLRNTIPLETFCQWIVSDRGTFYNRKIFFFLSSGEINFLIDTLGSFFLILHLFWFLIRLDKEKYN